MRSQLLISIILMALASIACSIGFTPSNPGSIYTEQPPGNVNVPPGDLAVVTSVTDGDTIEVQIGGVGYRVRYIGVNTPERDEPCYSEARRANLALVENRAVTLVADRENTDRFGRLLRYVYADGVFVNARLIEEGYAEVVQYPPNVSFAASFIPLEQAATAANRGCHPTGIFNDGNYER
jgi:endonuclease YncB( thermonuclease family)